MKNFIRAGIVGVASLTPFAALALQNVQSANVGDALDIIGGLIQRATPIVVGLALLGFFWGLAMYIFGAGDEKNKAKGRTIMIWGILALFIMLSVFGIVATLQSTFGISGSQQIQNGDIPSVNTRTSSNGGFFGGGGN